MNTRYRIKPTPSDYRLTDISHIGMIKKEGDEWSTYTKCFDLSSVPEFAAIRFYSCGVCAAYINGEFVAGNTGRYANRISCAECTSKLRTGENEIKLVLGGHYYQTADNTIVARRNARFSSVAAELELGADGCDGKICTNSSWTCESDLGITAPQCFSQVTGAEYDRFWLSAALWREEKHPEIPKSILNTAKGYGDYVSTPKQIYAEPSEILYTNMKKTADGLASVEKNSHVMYKFDNIYCGYVEIECEAEEDGEVELRFDYTGYPEDIDYTSPYANVSAKRLTVKKPLKAGKNHVSLIRRRAPAAHMMLLFNVNVKLTSVKIRLDMLNHENIGYFRCSDTLFNDMWEMGKYTHHICKHQEYESCPKNEMKYFSGDGILAALIDAYTFGDGDVTVSSLSYTEITSNVGLIYDKFIRNIGLWEYPAWRIVHAFNHYFYFNDTHLAEQHFEELAGSLDWMIGKITATGLIYQNPVFSGAFCFDTSSTDYTQHPDRLGEKPLLNALLYKALICMSSLAEVVGDERGEKWQAIAQKVKAAINDRLWSEEKQAYMDTFDESYIPQDGNALCLLFGIAEGERAEAVMKTLEEKLWTPYGSTVKSEPDAHKYSGNAVVSPMMNSHEAEARFLLGDFEGAIELMRRCWGSMIKKGATTFWEYANACDEGKPKHFTGCHAWSAGCTYLLSAYVLGVRPLTAGYEKLLFAPANNFDSFDGVIPSAKGLVAVSCETDGEKKTFTLTLPENIAFEAKLPRGAVLNVIKY
jgi:hypothetical protein